MSENPLEVFWSYLIIIVNPIVPTPSFSHALSVLKADAVGAADPEQPQAQREGGIDVSPAHQDEHGLLTNEARGWYIAKGGGMS